MISVFEYDDEYASDGTGIVMAERVSRCSVRRGEDAAVDSGSYGKAPHVTLLTTFWRALPGKRGWRMLLAVKVLGEGDGVTMVSWQAWVSSSSFVMARLYGNESHLAAALEGRRVEYSRLGVGRET